jgi:hypothetical protein
MMYSSQLLSPLVPDIAGYNVTPLRSCAGNISLYETENTKGRNENGTRVSSMQED